MRVLSLIIFLLGICVHQAHSQVLITILFGDKLNSPNLEFGLHAGVNFGHLSGIEEAKYRSDLNLGFYFNFRIKGELWFNPEVLVKSGGGVRGLTPYSTGDESLDDLLSDAKLERDLGYIQVPLLFKYNYYQGFGVEAGIQPALLLFGATDVFTDKVFDKDDLIFEADVGDSYTNLDFGLTGGLTWRPNVDRGVIIVARYTHGLVNVFKEDSAPAQRNRQFAVGVLIPIGVKKAEERRAQKALEGDIEETMQGDQQQ